MSVLEEGERVEIYRPLIADPKEVRKRVRPRPRKPRRTLAGILLKALSLQHGEKKARTCPGFIIVNITEACFPEACVVTGTGTTFTSSTSRWNLPRAANRVQASLLFESAALPAVW